MNETEFIRYLKTIFTPLEVVSCGNEYDNIDFHVVFEPNQPSMGTLHDQRTAPPNKLATGTPTTVSSLLGKNQRIGSHSRNFLSPSSIGQQSKEYMWSDINE